MSQNSDDINSGPSSSDTGEASLIRINDDVSFQNNNTVFENTIDLRNFKDVPTLKDNLRQLNDTPEIDNTKESLNCAFGEAYQSSIYLTIASILHWDIIRITRNPISPDDSPHDEDHK